MVNLSNAHNDVLPGFQAYLLDKKLAPEKNVPFYALWVSRFLNYSRKNNLSALEYEEAAVFKYIESLTADRHILDWQLQQASDAIRLYYFHYLKKTDERAAKAIVDESISGILNETKRLIRLKHYSKSTEKTYLQWIERFLNYVHETEKKKITGCENEDIKDFLSHRGRCDEYHPPRSVFSTSIRVIETVRVPPFAHLVNMHFLLSLLPNAEISQRPVLWPIRCTALFAEVFVCFPSSLEVVFLWLLHTGFRELYLSSPAR